MRRNRSTSSGAGQVKIAVGVLYDVRFDEALRGRCIIDAAHKSSNAIADENGWQNSKHHRLRRDSTAWAPLAAAP